MCNALIALILMVAATARAQSFPAPTPPILPGRPVPSYVTPAHVVQVESPKVKAAVSTSGFSPEFIHSVFPTKEKPGYMPVVAGKSLFCRGFGTQGGQYACYGDSKSADCFFDRYLNETPIAQKCGRFTLPVKMTKAETSEAEMK